MIIIIHKNHSAQWFDPSHHENHRQGWAGAMSEVPLSKILHQFLHGGIVLHVDATNHLQERQGSDSHWLG